MILAKGQPPTTWWGEFELWLRLPLFGYDGPTAGAVLACLAILALMIFAGRK